MEGPRDSLEDNPNPSQNVATKPFSENCATASFFHTPAPALIANIWTAVFVYAFAKSIGKKIGEKEGE